MVEMLKYLIGLFPNRNIKILDFFAGSGTTLQATIELNKKDKGLRQCILVTNNENDLCENVTYERSRRIIQGYNKTKNIHVPGLNNNNQGNPGTIYNTAPKVGYGSLASGRPSGASSRPSAAYGGAGVAPAPVNGTVPSAGVPVAPRPVMNPPGGRITLDPRESNGFGAPYEGGGMFTQPGMPSQPPMAGYPGMPEQPRQLPLGGLAGLGKQFTPGMWGGLQNGAGWPGMGNGQGYWGQQHQQCRDRMAKFRDNFQAMKDNRRGDFMPRFGGTY